MKHSPEWDKSPDFDKRDRFILSKGHASAALYSILAECGYFPKEELMTLSGIGETKALAIISYREKTPFTSIEDIKNVKGIGDKTFEKMREQISL